MRGPGIFAVAIVLAVASSSPVPSHAQAPSPRSMEAAQALFGLLFAHGFVSLNAQAVELAWPGIEGAVRAQKPTVDAATLAELRREFERIRLARLHEITKDLPKVLPEAFASVLQRIQAMTMETQDSFMKLLRERGLLN